MDYQLIAERIELVLASLSDVSDEELRELAEAYAKACQEVNQRLQEVHRLIKAGERSEAVRRAEIPPRLLDAVDALDLPDRNAWTDICTLKRLPQPPELLTQYVSELNEAYENERGLAGLLRQHRLLALAQAPLPKRLAVLRQLVELEPENVVWLEDLIALEKFWLDQLHHEIQEHLKGENLQAIEEILAELESAPWRTPPPAQLISQCRSAREVLRGKAFRHELEELARQICEAMEERNFARMEELVRYWRQRIAEAPQWADSELQQRIQPALTLVQQLEAHREAERRQRQLFTQFQQALVNPLSRAELERCYFALREAGVTIPPDMEERYEEILEGYRHRARFRRNLMLAAVAIVFLLAGAIVWTVQAQIRANQRVAEAVAALHAYIDHFQFEAAEKYVQQLENENPSLLKRPELIEVISYLTEARQNELRRQQRLTELIGEIERSFDNVPSARALEEAAKHARTDEEKDRIAALKSRAEQRWLEVRAKQEEQFRKRLDEISDELNKIAHSVHLSVEEESRQLTILLERINRLQVENRDRGFGLDRELSQIHTRVLGRLGEIAKISEREKLIRDLCSAASQGPEAYLATARRIAGRANQQELSDLGMVENDLALLEGLNGWNHAADLWNDRKTVFSIEVCTTLQEQLEAIQVSPPSAFPIKAQDLQKLEHYLSIFTQREQLVLTDVRNLYQEWKQERISDAWMVQLSDGRRYYSLEQPIRDIVAMRTTLNPTTERVTVGQNVAYRGRAPQTILFNRVEEALSSWSSRSWESSADKVLEEILVFSRKNPPELPELPLLFNLFYQTLSVARGGDVGWEAFWEMWKESMAKLRDQYPVGYDWVRVARESDETFPDLEGFFSRLPSAQEVLKQVANVRAEHRNIVWPCLEWVGILLEDNQRVWYVRPIGEDVPPDDSPLFILEPTTGGLDLALRRVGRWNGERGVVEAASSIRLYNGRPVVAFLAPTS